MIPYSISATALNVAMNCLARFEAEHVNRGKSAQGQAAAEGSAVHAGLEGFVKAVFVDCTHEWKWDTLVSFYEIGYLSIFGELNKSDQKYKDGITMLKNWYSRADLMVPGRQVCSVEQKLNFPVNIGGQSVPFNYIIDRLDRMPEGGYRVVDYKTNRWGLNPDDLFEKPQARAYALALQISQPELEEVWVEFDMLRHDGPVGARFTKEDNRATRDRFRAQFKRIGDTPAGAAPETLNPECNWCVRKTECSALKRNIAVGGIFGVSLDAAVDMRAQLEWQNKGIAAAIKELDQRILEAAAQEPSGVNEISGNQATAQVTVSTTRSVDAERVERIIGPTLWNKYGQSKVSITTIDSLLKGIEITDEQKVALRGIIYRSYGEPRVKIKPKK